MNIEDFARSTVGRPIIKALGAVMENRFRYRFFNPVRILTGADIHSGAAILEVGCGTGFFTLPAARLVGDQGILVAMDILQESVALVSRKVQSSGIKNVRVVKGNAMDTGLDSGSFDAVLLFGVIPAPVIPLTRLLPEMHRVLKPEGILAVWPHIPGWLPRSILKSELFSFIGRQNGVDRFKRCQLSQ